MVGSKSVRPIRRALGIALLAGSLAIGVTTMLSATRASAAVGVPHKTCTSSQPDGIPEPGQQITCAVSLLGGVTAGETVEIAPTAPSGSSIASCTGVTVLTPSPYTTTVTGTCKFVIAGTGSAGDVLLGNEVLNIPASTPANTSVTQTAQICETAVGCFPAAPMGVSGAGSCIDGTAIPGVGGCQPAAPGGTPTPPPPTCIAIPSDGFLCLPPTAPPPTCIAIPSDGALCFPPTAPQPTCIPIPSDGVLCIPPGGSPPSCLPIPGLPPPLGCPTTSTPTPPGGGPGGNTGGNNGGNGGGNGGSSGQTTGAVAAAATSNPFTGGPQHPAPVAAIALATAGFGVAIWALAGPALKRRRGAGAKLEVP